MSVRIRSYLGLALALAAVGSACGDAAADRPPAGEPGYVVREWHTREGLPHEDVYQVAQDTRGYLWVATRTGVARFDGSAFVHPPAREAREFYYGIVADRDGSVLFTPRAGHPVRYRDGQWTSEPLPGSHAGQAVGYVLRAPDGALWYSVRGAVLRIRNGGTEVFGPAHGISASNWTRFATDGSGQVWLASDGFLACYEQGQLERVALPEGSIELRLGSSRRGGPWVVTAGRVIKLDGSGGVELEVEVPPLLGAHYVNAAVEDHAGALWIGTRSQGLHVFARGNRTPVPTPADMIIALAEDRDGILWVGGSPGGLSAVSPKVYTLYNKAHGLTATGVTAVTADRAGAVWLANGDGGVARVQHGEIATWPLRDEARAYSALSVSAHPERGVWATGSSRVFWVGSERDAVQLVEGVPAVGSQPTSFAARNGDLWVLMAERRVGRWRGGVFRAFGAADGLSPAGVRSFREDTDGTLLVGTNDGLVLRFANERFAAALPASFSAGSAINVIFPAAGQYWLGTAADGLVVWTGERAVRIGTAHGLPDDNIAHLVADDHGFLWCGSERGIFRLRPEDVHAIVRGERDRLAALQLGADEGLPSVTCQGIYGPGALKGSDGRIWFATRQGALSIDPAAEALVHRAPVVAVDEVRVDGATQADRAALTISPRARRLEFHYSVLCLTAPRRVTVRHRLEGFDAGWGEAEGRRAAAYPRLPPGTYRFEVAAGFGPASEADSVAVVTVTVPERWWQAAWAQTAGFVLLVAGVGAAARAWSHRRLRRRIEKLEREGAIARERARIAQNIHDDVGASLTRISLLTQATAPKSPDAENMNRIYETAKDITRSLDEIVWAVNPQYDSLESFISYLTDFAQKFLGVAGIRCRLDIPANLPSLPLASELRHHLFLCCREALNNVVKHAGASEVLIRVSLPGSRLSVVIGDNGRGLGTPGAAAAERVSSGHGLGNLRERMERVGGRCEIESSTAGGTHVTLTVEVNAGNSPV